MRAGTRAQEKDMVGSHAEVRLRRNLEEWAVVDIEHV
jgi:hypothetical protein